MLKPTNQGKEPEHSNPNGRHRLSKLVFASAALVFVIAGFFVYFFAEALGIPAEHATTLGIAMLAVGFVDYIILRLWDRIFRD